MTTTSRLALVAFLALAGCGAQTDPDGDGGLALEDCTPLLTETGEYECPAGCEALSGQVVDEARSCVRRAFTVMACHPAWGTTTRSGDLACLDREGAPSPVLSGSVATWNDPDGTTVELYSAAGWVRCEGVEIPVPACETD